MYNSIFNNQEAKLNIHPVKNKKKQKDSLQKCEYVKSKTRLNFTWNKTEIKKTEKNSLNRFNFDGN